MWENSWPTSSSSLLTAWLSSAELAHREEVRALTLPWCQHNNLELIVDFRKRQTEGHADERVSRCVKKDEHFVLLMLYMLSQLFCNRRNCTTLLHNLSTLQVIHFVTTVYKSTTVLYFRFYFTYILFLYFNLCNNLCTSYIVHSFLLACMNCGRN